MDHHSVLLNGDLGILNFVSRGIPSRRRELDVVGLPGQRRKGHVDQRCALFIERSALALGFNRICGKQVGQTLTEAVENLQLIPLLQIDAAIPASLS